MTSSTLFAEAKRFIPGGVNSPVRAFRNVGGEPFFVAKAKVPGFGMSKEENTLTMLEPGVRRSWVMHLTSSWGPCRKQQREA